ncbi:MAG: aminotransferase class III-fold pyridoxal phosphate-dependent enzyme [Proteobacteria bacterium]|nr:aminotransferase class III-fold pyridoxal phosphate-dependent enzyme [Pseudomonadota bacterium]MBU4277744.1 aminotransferase class III-fold pyridoxal phosphate-dependent enzyme [Pseudomonadota bacterium]MBU4385150.1 aminotransferase class III-fold pyridoxal phosphate-dependent enzyme [Pseudomonadota bacterium]MBU4603983.1 aminotransferase class III-fold pyridoxal phosphate-dependent enzyme [Pseudomonadota bacterium]MCG2764757.1 aminotransferase class III-fold pyridoxal phosphate-dependent en
MSEMKLPPYEHRPLPYAGPSLDDVLALRQRYLSPAIMTYYKKPVMIVEGSMQYLYDETGRRYLDGFAGIVTVCAGHCHPYITEQVSRQLHTLQHTTTIYLHPVIAQYAQMLAERMPGQLSVSYFVNSGSEANDLALMMARVYTGNYEAIALRNGYHGGAGASMGLTSHSTWKFNFPHGQGVHHAMAPDCYRGPYGYDDPAAGAKYAKDVGEVIRMATPGVVAAFFAETIQGVGGTVPLPDGYLKSVYAQVRAAGGLCIADEVQTGFGRTGDHYWGFQAQGVIPDIVTMAKGIGNGLPLAAVVTTPEISRALAQRIHFNTFGGNPVSCAAGKAVLEVVDRENLQQRCTEIGGYLLEGLARLKERHQIIGDVRGRGLMTGVELVKDRTGKEPAQAECLQVFERAKDLGLLIGKGGFYGNVLRIKPPMCITKPDVDFMLAVLDQALSEV